MHPWGVSEPSLLPWVCLPVHPPVYLCLFAYVPVPQVLLEALHVVCDQHGILLIIDEAQPEYAGAVQARTTTSNTQVCTQTSSSARRCDRIVCMGASEGGLTSGGRAWRKASR